MEKEKPDKILSKIANFLSKKPEILSAYLYGSYEHGTQHTSSDLDIAVLLDPTIKIADLYEYMFKLQDETSFLVKDIKVEIIPSAVMSYPLYYTSVLFGKKIYSRDEKKRVKEEIDLWNRFEDIRDLYEMRHQHIIKDVKRRLNAR